MLVIINVLKTNRAAQPGIKEIDQSNLIGSSSELNNYKETYIQRNYSRASIICNNPQQTLSKLLNCPEPKMFL